MPAERQRAVKPFVGAGEKYMLLSSKYVGEQRRQSWLLPAQSQVAILNLGALLELQGHHAVASSVGTRPSHKSCFFFLVPAFCSGIQKRLSSFLD